MFKHFTMNQLVYRSIGKLNYRKMILSSSPFFHCLHKQITIYLYSNPTKKEEQSYCNQQLK